MSCPRRRDPAWKVSYLVVGIYQSNRNHLTRRVTLPIRAVGCITLDTRTPCHMPHASQISDWCLLDKCLPVLEIKTPCCHLTVSSVPGWGSCYGGEHLMVVTISGYYPANLDPVISSSCFRVLDSVMVTPMCPWTSQVPWDTNCHPMNPTNNNCLILLSNKWI